MNYTLAKELKDAGWNRQTRFHIVLSPKGEKKHYGRTKAQLLQMELVGHEVLPCPTLSELIEACGDKFKKLWRHTNGNWTAYVGTKTGKDVFTKDGATAEEAVANLWLALNRKENEKDKTRG